MTNVLTFLFHVQILSFKLSCMSSYKGAFSYWNEWKIMISAEYLKIITWNRKVSLELKNYFDWTLLNNDRLYKAPCLRGWWIIK